MRRILFLLTILCVAGFSAGCSKPNIELAVASQTNVNPDHSGRPSPVIMKMYELKSDLAFNQGDFIALFENPVQALGADLVAADELVFVPGEARKVVYQPDSKTRFVGILLGFRQMERAHWRAIKAVNPEESNKVYLELMDTSVLMVDEKTMSDWDPVKAVQQFQQRTAQPAPQPAAGTPPAASTPGQAAPAAPAAPNQGYVVPSAKRM